jgi:hypothetical protein
MAMVDAETLARDEEYDAKLGDIVRHAREMHDMLCEQVALAGCVLDNQVREVCAKFGLPISALELSADGVAVSIPRQSRGL